MSIKHRLETIQNEVIQELTSTVKFPDGLLPHTVFVEDEGEDSEGRGIPEFNEYKLASINPDGSCVLIDPRSNTEEERYLHEINIEWLIMVWAYYCDLTGFVPNGATRTNNPLEQPLRQLMDVAQLEITGIEESLTFALCEDALKKAGDEATQTLYAFLYAVERHERNISDNEVINSWNTCDGDDLDTKRLTPDEFAAMINDESFNDLKYWVRFIKM